MCTLILLHRCLDAAPLLVAANRDEFLDRPAAPPAVSDGVGVPIVAPLDLRAGGTWLGVNAGRVFAALTNRPTRRPDPTRRSRGLLVLDALAQGSASTAADRLAALPAGLYNPFNLVVADADQAFVLVYGDAPRLAPLDPGVHVIGNSDPLAPDAPKVARLRARAESAARGPAGGILDSLAQICRSHEGGGAALDDTCIHTSSYGTRSSTLLRIGATPRSDALHFADGPPCRTAYDDYTQLLEAAGRTTGASPGPRAARTAR